MSSPWFPYNRLHLNPPMRLFCFGHAGGVASSFKNWQSFFPAEVEVVPVQLPGRESRFRDPLIHSMEVLIKELWPVMMPLLSCPSAFFGHSLGALIAYELIKKAESENVGSAKTLFISACAAPHRLKDCSYHKLDDQEFLNHIEGYGAMPKQLMENPEALLMLLPRLRADFQLLETYQGRKFTQVHSSIVAFGGIEDKHVSQENLMRWSECTKASFTSYLLPGDHFYLFDHLPTLSQTISSCLEANASVLLRP